ncbi:hypothetical protein E8E11_004773 [Didymella keratinophila]|nr:hypothetical protein E8E11_004773 [Didymella keratinophila]
MAEHVRAATQFLLEARQWQDEVMKEERIEQQAQLERYKEQNEVLTRRLGRKNAAVEVARSCMLCLDKKAKLDAQ